MSITWSGQSRCDLHAIRDFIARDSEHYARLQVERLISRVERAAAVPSRGHPVHEFIESGYARCMKAPTGSFTVSAAMSFKW